MQADYRRKAVMYTHLDADPNIMGRDGEPNEFMKKVIESKRRAAARPLFA